MDADVLPFRSAEFRWQARAVTTGYASAAVEPDETGCRLPRLSVIVPTFNSEKTIAEALESVAAQQYPVIEVLVIDDGSTDRTVSVVNKRFPSTQLFTQSNKGAAAARNQGLAQCSGDLIAFLDADDVWFPGKLLAQVECLRRNPDAGFCYSSWLVGETAPGPERIRELAARDNWPSSEVIDEAQSGWLYVELLYDVLIHTSTLLIRRELVERTGTFDESLRRGQDYDYWLRMCRIAPGVKLARPLSFYRQHVDNSIRKPQPRNYAFEILTRAVARWGTMGPDGRTIERALVRAALARKCRDHAYLHARTGSGGIALRASLRAIGQNPTDARNLWASFKILVTAIGRIVSTGCYAWRA